MVRYGAVGSTRLMGIAPLRHFRRGSTNSHFSGKYGLSKFGIDCYDFWVVAANVCVCVHVYCVCLCMSVCICVYLYVCVSTRVCLYVCESAQAGG